MARFLFSISDSVGRVPNKNHKAVPVTNVPITSTFSKSVFCRAG